MYLRFYSFFSGFIYSINIRFLHLAKPHTAVVVKVLAIASTDLKLPVLEAGKPASSTSTPHFSSCLAIFNLSSKVKLTPGVCSPSLSVVSKFEYVLPLKTPSTVVIFQYF